MVKPSKSSSRVTSSRTTVIRGSRSIASPIRRENSARSTASACPAGTAHSSASRSSTDPARRISCFSSQGAVFSLSDFNEFEHTSSPKSAVWCAGVCRTGRISYNSTSAPCRAAIKAASGPASPPPITRIRIIDLIIGSWPFFPGTNDGTLPYCRMVLHDVADRIGGHMLADLRDALRQLRKAPGFAATAIITLALGIGATTAIFTLVHQVMLKSLPVANPDELWRVGDKIRCCNWGGYTQDEDGDFSLFSWEMYKTFREHTPEFTDLAALQAGNAPLGVRKAGSQGAGRHSQRRVRLRKFLPHPWHPALDRPHDDRRRRSGRRPASRRHDLPHLAAEIRLRSLALSAQVTRSTAIPSPSSAWLRRDSTEPSLRDGACRIFGCR